MNKTYFVIGNKDKDTFFKSSKLDKSKPIGNFYLFSSIKEALSHGYIPCSKCNPIYCEDAPIYIKLFFDQEKNIYNKKVDIWLKKEHNLSLQEYFEFIKINQNSPASSRN